MTDSRNSLLRRLSPRRLALLATTVLGMTAGALIVAPAVAPNSLAVYAQTQGRPVGFADIVEKVKPAVISVRVKMDVTPQPSADDSPFPPGSEMDQYFRRFGGRPEGMPNAQPRGRGYVTGQGSGFFITSDGYAVTNNHVVDKATSVQVTTDDGKTHIAKVIGVDQRTDLALIKVEGGNYPFVKLSERPPRVGDWVIAVGNPFGLGGTVTAGIVSARGRDIGSGPYDDYIQIDAPVNKGNSGGPTFDVDGNVIGVNTAIFSPSGGSVGIAFAIPSDTVKTVVAQLKEKGSVLRGWIGVQVQTITPEVAQNFGLKRTDGALVTEPQQNGPADKAGIETGDVIVSVNGSPVKDSRDLAKRIGSMPPGTTVRLVIDRKGSEKTITLTLGELPNVRESRAEPTDRDQQRFRNRDQDVQRPDDGSPNFRNGRRGDDQYRSGRDNQDDADVAPRSDRRQFRDRDQFAERDDRQRGNMPRLGLSLSPGGSEGVVIAAVEPDSLAAQTGFKAGDVIIEIGGAPISSPQDVRRALRAARNDGKNSVEVRVKSQDGTRTITVPLIRA